MIWWMALTCAKGSNCRWWALATLSSRMRSPCSGAGRISGWRCKLAKAIFGKAAFFSRANWPGGATSTRASVASCS
ncbi:hypothetical protein D3C85_1815880 [compost metagenome]